MATGFTNFHEFLLTCREDAVACKAKWNQLIPDYRQIVDFHIRTGTNGANYWEMTSAKHVVEGLPKAYLKE